MARTGKIRSAKRHARAANQNPSCQKPSLRIEPMTYFFLPEGHDTANLQTARCWWTKHSQRRKRNEMTFRTEIQSLFNCTSVVTRLLGTISPGIGEGEPNLK